MRTFLLLLIVAAMFGCDSNGANEAEQSRVDNPEAEAPLWYESVLGEYGLGAADGVSAEAGGVFTSNSTTLPPVMFEETIGYTTIDFYHVLSASLTISEIGWQEHWRYLVARYDLLNDLWTYRTTELEESGDFFFLLDEMPENRLLVGPTQLPRPKDYIVYRDSVSVLGTTYRASTLLYQSNKDLVWF